MKISKNIAIIVLVSVRTMMGANAFSQIRDSSDHLFHDGLLDHLVGKWDITSFAHGSPFSATIEAEWALQHQYMHIHFRGNEPDPSLGFPLEYEQYIGFDQRLHRYTVIETSTGGGDNFECPYQADRSGDVLKLLHRIKGSDSSSVERMIWEPASGSWVFLSRWETGGKEGRIILDMKLVKRE